MAVADKLRSEILTGAIPPGTWLSQSELASRFGVSRIPVRDALQQLASERLVELVPGKGARAIEITQNELSQIFDLRILLETDLLRHAMAVVPDTYYPEVRYALEKSSLEAGRAGWIEGDWFFHLTLYTPARRQRQVAMIEELRKTCVMYAARYDALVDNTSRWLEDHEKIACAYMERRVDDATDLMTRHIQGAQKFLSEGKAR